MARAQFDALVVLGNTGDRREPAVVETLRRYLASDDSLLRSHAVWAAKRLGLDWLALEAGADRDAEPSVRDEWQAVVDMGAAL